MRIVTENLNFIYSEKSPFAVAALKDVSLAIEEGDFYGIIGHTGSGKSTLVQHLNGLIRLKKNSGKVFVGDFDLSEKKCDLKKLRSKLGMLFQYPEYQLFADTVFADVAFGLKNFEKNNNEDLERKVKEAIETVGLCYEEIKDKSPFDLSGGQKRRVAIAGVIVTKPEVLVLDEPVAGLDPQGKKDLFALLHSLHKTFVKTIVIVSHDMDDVAENCNKIAVFSEGKVYKVGSPKEIFSGSDDLTSLGLDLPMTAYLDRELRKVGVNLDTDYTLKDFIEKLKAFKEKR